MRKGGIDLTQASDICKLELHPERTRGSLHLPRFTFGIKWIGWIAEIDNRLGYRHHFEEHLQALSRHFGQEQVDACDVSAGSVETVNEADPDRVGALHKEHRNRLGRCFGGERTMRGLKRNKDGHLTTDQSGNQRWQSNVLNLSPPVLDHHILAV